MTKKATEITGVKIAKTDQRIILTKATKRTPK